MDKQLKTKLVMFFSFVFFMLFYYFVFGSKNMALGLTIVMAALMSLASDLSFKPKISFVKVLSLLLILGIVSFLNNPISILGCILTFIVVFATTFTSYHLFGASVYMPYLMAYLMMMSIPITFEELPMRLLSLIFGAVLIVGLNIVVNRKKDYKLSKATINKLICELNESVDLKLNGKEVLTDFNVVNGFYSSLINRFEYKYFPNKNQKSVLNIVKAFQSVGYILKNYNLTDNELNYLKNVLLNIKEITAEEIFEGAKIENKVMSIILLNLEIVASEIHSISDDETVIFDKKYFFNLIKSIIKNQFTFKSVKFTFAFKMAFMMFLWEFLTLIFNLPYTKWLYFITIPIMVPYIDELAFTAKARIKGTFAGVLIFSVIFILVPYIPMSSRLLIISVMMICMLVMVLKLQDKFILTVSTTIMSVMAALLYLEAPQAVELKILWVLTGVAIVSLFNLLFLPYSIEKETRNNLKINHELNEKFITMIKEKCGGSDSNDAALLVVSNIVQENIKVNDDILQLYNMQKIISQTSHFILEYIEINDVSDNLKVNISNIINDNVVTVENLNIKEIVIAHSMKYLMEIYKKERENYETWYGNDETSASG